MSQGIPTALSGNDVIRMFSLRAGGATLKKIAKEYKCSEAVVSDVLHRKRNKNVPVPKDIEAAVRGKFIDVSTRKPRRRAHNSPPVSSLLAQYMAAVHQLNLSTKECLKAGVPRDALELLSATYDDFKAKA